VRDFAEGVAADGSIVTGVDRRAVPAEYEPVLATLSAQLEAYPAVASYLYGSVATGRARRGVSDVDFLTVGLPADEAAQLGSALSVEFESLCRGVEIAVAQDGDLAGTGDAAYGMRVFLKHYCVHLGGPDPSAGLPAFPADARAARGFNGDIAVHLARWREAVDRQEPARLGRHVARKTLLATAGLVSVLDGTWTTDRELAARSYARRQPDRAAEMSLLWDWANDTTQPDHGAVLRVLSTDAVVQHLVDEFADVIGVWPVVSSEPAAPGDV
jgi:uncharacterized protein